MEKFKLQLKKEESIEVFYKGQTVLVKPYISMVEKNIIYQEYAKAFSKDGEIFRNYLEAEMTLVISTLDIATNIDIDDLDIDEFSGSELWKQIYSQINNYEDILQDLKNIREAILIMNAAERSRGVAFDQLAYKTIEFFDKTDLSQGSLEKTLADLKAGLAHLDEKFVDKEKKDS